MHYAPTTETLVGERETIWTFLGTDRLAPPMLEHNPDMVLHGHAHAGTFEGRVGEVPVYNGRVPVMGEDFWVFELSGERRAPFRSALTAALRRATSLRSGSASSGGFCAAVAVGVGLSPALRSMPSRSPARRRRSCGRPGRRLRAAQLVGHDALFRHLGPVRPCSRPCVRRAHPRPGAATRLN